jgi:F-type H+-transporting ATPase subunit b
MRKSLLSLTALGLAMAPALAHAAGDPGHGGGGMPQLEFGNPWIIAQVVWLFVIFGALYFALSRFALPQVAETLAARRTRIDGDLGAAQAAKDAADAAIAEHQAATAKARAEGQAAIAAATQQAQAEAAARGEALNARLNAQITAAETRIAAGRDAAMKSLQTVATDTAGALVDRLIGAGTDRGLLDRAVGAAIAVREAR